MRSWIILDFVKHVLKYVYSGRISSGKIIACYFPGEGKKD